MNGYSSISFLCLAISACSLLGCTESSVDPDDHGQEPFFVRLSSPEDTVETGTGSPALPTLRAGDTSAPFAVSFHDREGDPIEYRTSEGFSLGVTISDTSRVRLVDPNPQTPWSFRLLGVSGGSAIVRIELRHGGHADYVSSDIAITVAE